MSTQSSHSPDSTPVQIYEIRIGGHLSQQWQDWFEGMTIRLLENGDTLLTGPVADQSALYGILRKVRDLGLTLRSLNPVSPQLTTLNS